MDLSTFGTSLDQTYRRLRGGLTDRDRGYDWRMEQLRALRRLIDDNDRRLSEAMWKDLRKSPFECQATEQGIVISEIDHTLKHLRKWMRPKRVSTPLYNQPGRSQIVYEPYGLTLIVGAWNYPIQLLLAPLVGAIAGGNGAILKPSEISANTAHLIAELLPKYLDPDLFAVIEGGVDETGLLLDKAFDYIFFTGSGPVGRIVMTKAAAHLTPVTLELGGKSPAIVLDDANLAISARRIAWGKFMNAGQTCVAPDYVLVQTGARERFLAEIKKCLHAFFGDDPRQSPDYCRIVNERNFDRLAGLKEGLQVLHGGDARREELYIAPTLVAAGFDSPIMLHEIFGPLLPIVDVADVDAAMAHVNSFDKPLALYVFTETKALAQRVIAGTSSGGVCVNDVVLHLPVATLPFGGVGASGMGHYHGEFSFHTFTHAKGVLAKWSWPDIRVRYAPYSNGKAKLLRWLFS